MALSNSYDFSLTARQVIVYALQKLNVLALTQALDADEAAAALQELNLMLKTWQRRGPFLWKRVEGSVSLVAATASYDLAATLNPLRIMSIRYRDTSSNDLPMRLFTRQEYFDLPSKTSTGTPTQYYFDPQRGAPTLYVWPVKATVTTETFKVTYHKRTDDLDDLANDIDIPQEELETIGYGLAARLLDSYGIEGEVANRILMRAEQLGDEAQDFEREPVTRFVPGRS
nr:hypothetical protein [uncultured archaeon]